MLVITYIALLLQKLFTQYNKLLQVTIMIHTYTTHQVQFYINDKKMYEYIYQQRQNLGESNRKLVHVYIQFKYQDFEACIHYCYITSVKFGQ